MLQRKGSAITFYGFFLSAKVGKTGLSPTIDVHENGVEIVTAGSATEVGDGLYKYALPAASVDANGEYTAVFKTSDTTVEQMHVPAMWVTPNWIDNLMQTGGGSSVTVVGPVAEGGDIEVVQGDDYYNVDGRALDWSSSGWLNLTGSPTLTLTAKGLNGGSWTATPTAPTVGSSMQTVRVELASSDTSLFNLGDPSYSFDISATTTVGHKATLVRATVTVLEQYTT